MPLSNHLLIPLGHLRTLVHLLLILQGAIALVFTVGQEVAVSIDHVSILPGNAADLALVTTLCPQ